MLVRLLVVCGLFSGVMHVGTNTAYASPESAMEVTAAAEDSETAPVNDAINAKDEAKDLVDVLNPTVEAIYNVQDDEWHVGTSASLYDFESNSIHLGRIKVGYLSANAFYGGVDVDLPGIVSRYIGGNWEQLDVVLEKLSKYGSFGYIGGYDVDAERVVHGPSFGATWRF
jgi:hypothetical protein